MLLSSGVLFSLKYRAQLLFNDMQLQGCHRH